jgi:aldehyde:ferredoxin oxidoreductase
LTKKTKITESARGEDCQIRLPGVCNFNSETTMFCHLGGAGMALKSDTIHGAYGCYDCHMVCDGHIKSEYESDILKLWFFEGMVKTQLILLAKGLIRC